MGTKNRKITRRTVLAGAAATGASFAIHRRARAVEPVKIGFTMPKTGYLGVACPVAYQAYELWRDQVNAAGGLKIAGSEPRPIEFISYDDQSEPSKTVQIYQKMITQDKVDLLLSPYGTPFHLALGPVAERHKFPIVGSTSNSTLLRDLGVKYMWAGQQAPDVYAPEMVKFMQSVGIDSASMLTLQLPASLEFKKFLTPELEKAGIRLDANDEYPNSITDMTAMVGSVKAAGSKAVLGLSYPLDSALYVKTAREMKIDVPMQLLFIGPALPFFSQQYTGADLEGLMTIGEWSPSQTAWPKAKPFYDAYMAKWNEKPDYLDSVISYASCEILEQAVAKVGLDHEKLREVISTDTFDTIKGPIKFDGNDNVATKPGLLQVQNGELEIVWPKEIATATFKPKQGWS
ncbi:amino acid ABC transporter substrate-binding protein [Zavarzinia compransoris]|uniref:amino acid ABC transporter substrate-binding protein n=1 Tax=Zavarzinia marina TaxID=2911065 RepID=UPI001F256C4C|nr:amino acid ABC transporter substrate-binding protein [Zavarzinia marina]MCF4167372.1 amino acid ABC transporter substrate-binding protein [Zavarzinia marina]